MVAIKLALALAMAGGAIAKDLPSITMKVSLGSSRDANLP